MLSNDYQEVIGGGGSGGTNLTPKSNVNVNTLTLWDNNGLTANQVPDNFVELDYNRFQIFQGKQNVLNSASEINLASATFYGMVPADPLEPEGALIQDTKQLNYFTYKIIEDGLESLSTALPLKQNLITDGSLSIARTAGLEAALASKQPIITNNSLNIAHVNNLQSSLNSKVAYFNTDEIICGGVHCSGGVGSFQQVFIGLVNVGTTLAGKQNIITNNSLNIAHVNELQAALDSKLSAFNSDSEISLKSITFIGLVQNPDNAQGEPIIGESTIDITSLRSIITSLGALQTGKQDVLTTSSVPMGHVAGLEAALAGKQSTIVNNSLNIAHVNNLQSSLNSKQATITDGSLTIARTANLQTTLTGLQSSIDTANLSIATNVTNLSTQINIANATNTVQNGRITVVENEIDVLQLRTQIKYEHVINNEGNAIDTDNTITKFCTLEVNQFDVYRCSATWTVQPTSSPLSLEVIFLFAGSSPSVHLFTTPVTVNQIYVITQDFLYFHASATPEVGFNIRLASSAATYNANNKYNFVISRI